MIARRAQLALYLPNLDGGGAERMMGSAGTNLAMPDIDSRQRGHSLQATARLRF